MGCDAPPILVLRARATDLLCGEGITCWSVHLLVTIPYTMAASMRRTSTMSYQDRSKSRERDSAGVYSLPHLEQQVLSPGHGLSWSSLTPLGLQTSHPSLPLPFTGAAATIVAWM